jgi:RNA polymerase sigma-70 factor (ECF subfamily)
MAQYTSDDDLIYAVRNGDETAFAQLQKRHWSWVYRLMVAMVHDSYQAEDLAQEAFCRVYHHLYGYTAQGQFVSWLKRIAVNQAKNFLRDHRREVRVLQFETEAIGIEDSRLDPQAIFSSHLLRQEIHTALSTLHEEQQQVLLLYYFNGMSVQSIAEMLHCPAGTVKSRLFYGRRQLRQSLMTIWDANCDHQKGVQP